MTGKEKCEMLRKIRRQIAEANDIPYIPEEADICEYQGDDCTGSCPKCEAEIEYLEARLLYRRKQGQPVTLAGINGENIPFHSELQPMEAGTQDPDSEEEARTLERMKHRMWSEIVGQDFPAEILVRLHGAGIVTLEEFMECGACDLESKFGVSVKVLREINTALERNGLPELKGMRFVERRHIRGMMRGPRR